MALHSKGNVLVISSTKHFQQSNHCRDGSKEQKRNARTIRQSSLLSYFPSSHNFKEQPSRPEVVVEQRGHSTVDFESFDGSQPMTPPTPENKSDCLDSLTPNLSVGELELRSMTPPTPAYSIDQRHWLQQLNLPTTNPSRSHDYMSKSSKENRPSTLPLNTPSLYESVSSSNASAQTPSTTERCTFLSAPLNSMHNAVEAPSLLETRCELAVSNSIPSSGRGDNGRVSCNATNEFSKNETQNHRNVPGIPRKRRANDRPLTKNSLRRFQQLYIDLGQRDFAQQIICPICGMLYVHGVEDDAKQHSRICNQYQHGVSLVLPKLCEDSVCCRWTEEPMKKVQPADAHLGYGTKPKNKPVATKNYILKIRPTDKPYLVNKLREVRCIVEKEMGFVTGTNVLGKSVSSKKNYTTFIAVSNNRVVGMAEVESIDRAFRLQSGIDDNWFTSHDEAELISTMYLPLERSQDPQAALLGVHVMWVHSKFRKRGLARKLIDVARERTFYGFVVPRDKVAFSSPTQAGIRFASRYCHQGNQNEITATVLVYDCG